MVNSIEAEHNVKKVDYEEMNSQGWVTMHLGEVIDRRSMEHGKKREHDRRSEVTITFHEATPQKRILELLDSIRRDIKQYGSSRDGVEPWVTPRGRI